MDQLALWATQTGMELIKTIPPGKLVANILAPDGVGQPISLLRFYILHIVIIPVAVLVLSFLHFYRIRQNKEVLPYL
jgi:quinol-cytochrome oxidoreductase complex cytochrome b subunit